MRAAVRRLSRRCHRHRTRSPSHMPAMLKQERAGQRHGQSARLRRRQLACNLQRQRAPVADRDRRAGRHDRPRRQVRQPGHAATCDRHDARRTRTPKTSEKQADADDRRSDDVARLRGREPLATYTGKAHMNGPDGDLTADKIELYLTESGGELERAEADGSVVSSSAESPCVRRSPDLHRREGRIHDDREAGRRCSTTHRRTARSRTGRL